MQLCQTSRNGKKGTRLPHSHRLFCIQLQNNEWAKVEMCDHHTHETKLAHLCLPDSTREMVAAKLADDAENFYNGWRGVFTTTNTKKLICAWHIDQMRKDDPSSEEFVDWSVVRGGSRGGGGGGTEPAHAPPKLHTPT